MDIDYIISDMFSMSSNPMDNIYVKTSVSDQIYNLLDSRH